MAGNGTITSANAVLMLAVPGLFPTPQQMQQFSVDDIYDFEDVEFIESQMTADGHLAFGWTPKEVVQGITLNADSSSIPFFETWYRAMQTSREVLTCTGSITLPSIGRSYAQTRGAMKGYKPASDAKKVLQPRKFRIVWESVLPQPV